VPVLRDLAAKADFAQVRPVWKKASPSARWSSP
jgi:hypothetical protein